MSWFYEILPEYNWLGFVIPEKITQNKQPFWGPFLMSWFYEMNPGI